ncbi:MAG: hypothetical protein NDI69_06700 [Bacteriovoracaceae bacterium]|nr:hypothetical protein [Bacteriovoracaceae bacterium]
MNKLLTTTFVTAIRPSTSFCSSKNTSADKFGTFHLNLPDGKFYPVEELHYEIENGKRGFKIIPVVDRESDFGSPGYENDPKTHTIGLSTIVKGCETLDEEIRKAYGIQEGAEFVAVMSYQHHENDTGSLQELADHNFLKLENSQTHSALYIGNGRTRNSPYNYHGKRLQVSGYPANIYVIKPDGIPTEVFLLNWFVASKLINEAGGHVKFPQDYKLDNYHLISMKEVMNHFRGWMDPNWVNPEYPGASFHELLTAQNVFALYCCEFTTFTLNLALNLPFNLKGFQSVFGQAEGRELWKITERTWKELTGENIPVVSDFTPLWKQQSLPANTNETGKGLAFKPQNTADIISCFMRMYCPWYALGVGLSSTILLSFIPEVMKRTGLEDKDLLPLFIEAVNEMAFHASLVDGFTVEAIQKEIETHVSATLPQIASLVTSSVKSQMNRPDTVKRRRMLTENGLPSQERAFIMYSESVQLILNQADNIEPKQSIHDQLENDLEGRSFETNAKFYSPPAIYHRIATGIYPANSLIKVKAVGTVMDVRDVEVHGETVQPSVTNNQVTGRK